jgi:hypothetical protein
MRTLVIAAFALAVLAAPAAAYAQQNAEDPLQLKYEAERRDQERVEREYNAMMRKTQRGQTETVKKDPWGIVRPVENQSKDKPR